MDLSKPTKKLNRWKNKRTNILTMLDLFLSLEKNDEDREKTAEEMKDQQYKFVPFYGFVPVNDDGEVEETAKDYGNLKYTFHPYYGFLPTPTDGEVETQLYKLDPVVGFYPSEKTEETVEEEEGTELEAR